MANRFRIEVDGEAQFDREFRRIDGLFNDFSVIGPDVREKFFEIEKAQFATEGAAGRSGRWKELSSRYNAQKIDQYGAGLKILERYGELRDSLIGEGPGMYYRVSKDNVEVGTTVPHGIYHQRGAGRLPKREVISFSDRQRNEMMKVVQIGLVRELRKGSFYVEARDRV